MAVIHVYFNISVQGGVTFLVGAWGTAPPHAYSWIRHWKTV